MGDDGRWLRHVEDREKKRMLRDEQRKAAGFRKEKSARGSIVYYPVGEGNLKIAVDMLKGL